MKLFPFKKSLTDPTTFESSPASLKLEEDDLFHDIVPIGSVTWRTSVKVAGRIHSIRILPWAEEVVTLECTVTDPSGGITLIFLGAQDIGGLHLGNCLIAQGVANESNGRLALLNPEYTLLHPRFTHRIYPPT